MSSYSEACTEVSEILQYLIKDDYNKIPSEIIEAIEENKSREYVFNYDENIELKEQKLLKETRAILFNLFRDYLATSEQKEKIIRMQNEERNKLNEQKKIKYNVDNILKKDEMQKLVKCEINTNEKITALAKVEKENFLVRILRKIKSFFRKT